MRRDGAEVMAPLAVAWLVVLVVGLAPGTAAGETPDRPDGPEVAPGAFDRLNVEEASTRGRVELTVGQGLHGGLLGLEGCLALQCESTTSLVALSAAGATAGGAGAWFATPSEGITSGLANAVNSGALWGGLAGLGLGAVARLDHPTAMGATMAGHLVGGTAGLVVADVARPTGGDVALVNAFGLWSATLYSVATVGIAQIEQSPGFGIGSTLTVAAAGGAGGALVARHLPMSRTRVALTSLAGWIGLGSGVGAVRLATGGEASRRTLSIAATVGAVGGLVGGGLWTRTFAQSRHDRAMEAGILSVGTDLRGDGGVVGTVGGRF